MKKFGIFLSSIMIIILCMFSTAFAASVLPQLFPGNDSNPADYTPPAGYIHYEIPGSGAPGTYTVSINSSGAIDPNGPFKFTVVVGTAPGESYTKVLSWSSNFPIYAVIVKGGDAFNLYQYDPSVRADTNLVSPTNESGQPADVSHVSIVYNPEEIPSVTPTPTPTPTLTPTPTPCPPCPPTNKCCTIVLVIFILLIILFFLLGILFGKLPPNCFGCKNKMIDIDKTFNNIGDNDLIDIDANIDINSNNNINKNNQTNSNNQSNSNNQINNNTQINNNKKHPYC